MKGLFQLLGYYKFLIKSSFKQSLLLLSLRRKIQIGKGCKISKDFKFGKDNVIRDRVKIGQSVKIGNDTVIGNNTTLNQIEINDNSHIEGGVKTTGYGNGIIRIGKESYIGIYTILDWSENIEIGDFVHIAGPSTGIWTHTSSSMCLNSIPLKNKTETYRPTQPVTIENNVYIGGNCTIYPGVTIHHHSIIAPNSAVNKDVESYSLYGGVPAKKIKNITP